MKSMSMRYVLDEQHNVVACDDLHEWAKWLATDARLVRQEHVNGHYVSTVFLGIDHSWHGAVGAPIVFETMVFEDEDGSWDELYCERYSTWEQALAGHELTVMWVEAGMPDDASASA